jgi:hypothetical protein
LRHSGIGISTLTSEEKKFVERPHNSSKIILLKIKFLNQSRTVLPSCRTFGRKHKRNLKNFVGLEKSAAEFLPIYQEKAEKGPSFCSMLDFHKYKIMSSKNYNNPWFFKNCPTILRSE